jgi:molybdate transport system substrate-binding protein
MRKRTTLIVSGLAALLVLGTSAASQARDGRQAAQVTVLAASSLTNVFPLIDPSPRYTFGGSDTLAGQIRLGAPADVFAAANSALPDKLYAQGLVEKPVVFTTNRLVLVTPAANPAGITTVFDLRRPGIKLIVGTPTVPIGSYTRTILKNLALTDVLADVVSQETDVRSILGKVALGEADAGFVYATDARTVADRVKVVRLPAWAQPPIRYEIAVVRATARRRDAVAFINRVLAKAGQAKLRAAGFGAVKRAVRSYNGG